MCQTRALQTGGREILNFGFLEIKMILEEKYQNTRLIRSEEFFFREHFDFGRKIAQLEIDLGEDLFLGAAKKFGRTKWVSMKKV